MSGGDKYTEEKEGRVGDGGWGQGRTGLLCRCGAVVLEVSMKR